MHQLSFDIASYYSNALNELKEIYLFNLIVNTFPASISTLRRLFQPKDKTKVN